MFIYLFQKVFKAHIKGGQNCKKKMHAVCAYDNACALLCPILHTFSPDLLDRRYVDIYCISMGNSSFQSFPMPFRSPTKPIHFTKEIENLRGENGMPRFFQFLCMKITF